MRLYDHGLILHLIAAAGSLGAVSLARDDGVTPGFSGGPGGGGESCIACHTFNRGPGSVSLLSAPRRYRPGALYNLQVRIQDAQQVGAGFQISAEDFMGPLGTFEISDSLTTQLMGDYVTHTREGYDDSLADWAANGGRYTYSFRWRAPTADLGRVTFYVAGNAVNNFQAFEGDRFYFTHAVSTFAVPGDHDADEDIDLVDLAAFQRCFHAGAGNPAAGCLVSDFNGDETLSMADVLLVPGVLTGPTAVEPGPFLIADEVRGGLLYDDWMRELGVSGPSTPHPLYPAGGPVSGSKTYRCKECHGWDYRGVDGAYGNDPAHVTGIPGIFGTTKTAQEIYDLLTADTIEMPDVGHDMDAYGMTDSAIWDATRMALTATVDTDGYIAPNGTFLGISFPLGQIVYETRCFLCHGEDGQALNFAGALNPEYVGTIADENPWELLHKIRFGHPQSPMGGMLLQDLTPLDLRHLGAYCATLPP